MLAPPKKGGRCGTPSGYNRHQQRDETPCEACAAARAEYDRRQQEADEAARKSRLGSRAQQRARAELTRRYPDEYDALYRKHKAALYAEEGVTA